MKKIDKNTLFYELSKSADPDITGNQTDATQVELNAEKENHFHNKEEQLLFNQYLKETTEVEDVMIGTSKIPYPYKLTELIFYTVKKNIKKTDFVTSFIGLRYSGDILVSQKVMDILENFNLPVHSKIPSRIISTKDGSEWGDYFLLQFPMYPLTRVNYKKSAFFNKYQSNEPCLRVANYEEYNKAIPICVWRSVFCVSEIIPYDIINLQASAGLFISETLYTTLKNSNLIGLEFGPDKLLFEGNDMAEYQFKYPEVFSMTKWIEQRKVTVYIGKGYERKNKSFYFGSLSEFSTNKQLEIYSSGLGHLDRIGYINNVLSYIDIFPYDDYETSFSNFNTDVFNQETLLNLQEKYEWVKSKNKVHIYFKELCLIFSCFEKAKDSRGKRIRIFHSDIREFIESKYLKL